MCYGQYPVKRPPLSLLLLALLFAAPASADPLPALVDSGTFRISLKNHVLGTERFTFESSGDSLIVSSYVVELIPHEDGADTLQKRMGLVVKALDYDLKNYESHQTYLGQRLHRGLVMGDTSFTSYFQINEEGSGDELVRPPGRIFVIDPQVFTLYDVICRNLHGRTFDQRELLTYMLGATDTTVQVLATNLGVETIRWGARLVPARKIGIHDGHAEYFLWMSDQGHMLRLTQPAYEMVVERMRPAVRRPAARRPRTSG